MSNEYHYVLQRKVSIWEEMPFIISASSKEDADNIVDGLISNHNIEDLEDLSERNNLVKCEGTEPSGHTYYRCSELFEITPSNILPHKPQYHWGYRHFLFMVMGLCLFVLQVVEIINLINKYHNVDN